MMRPGSAIYPSLKDKRVVITGGGSGIGAGLVEAFVRQGAEVHFLDIAKEDSQALIARLEGAGPKPAFHFCNLKYAETIAAVFAQIGHVDVLVNNAGNDDRHTLEEVTPDYFDHRIAVNLKHMLFCAKAVAPGMKAAGAGVPTRAPTGR